MTIARDFTSEPGFYGDETGTLRWWDGAQWTPKTLEEPLVPAALRIERLDAQIASFERAGYRLETRSGMQAVLVKARERRFVPRIFGAGKVYHRVIVTVDPSGAVRFA